MLGFLKNQISVNIDRSWVVSSNKLKKRFHLNALNFIAWAYKLEKFGYKMSVRCVFHAIEIEKLIQRMMFDILMVYKP